MIVSAKEALYHIGHTEQQYEWGMFDKKTFQVKLEYFVNALADYDYGKAESECSRLNNKYDFSIKIGEY